VGRGWNQTKLSLAGNEESSAKKEEVDSYLGKKSGRRLGNQYRFRLSQREALLGQYGGAQGINKTAGRLMLDREPFIHPRSEKKKTTKGGVQRRPGNESGNGGKRDTELALELSEEASILLRWMRGPDLTPYRPSRGYSAGGARLYSRGGARNRKVEGEYKSLFWSREYSALSLNFSRRK